MAARRITQALMILSVFFALVFASPLEAQNATGVILGHVQDPSGAAVPGAKVTLRNVNTGITSTFTTTSSGDYVFVNVIPGTYEVTCEAKGFKTGFTKGLVLQVEQTLRQDFNLEVGALVQRVAVTATAPMLQADNPTVGEVTSRHYLQTLPLNGRDFTTLVGINAGVSQPAGGIQTSIFGLHGLNDTFRTASVDGARPGSVSYTLDGVTDTNLFFSTITAVPSNDAVEEFKLQNGLYSAQYGDGSAQVNVALRSGTNAFHGSAYDYVRNDVFQPRNPISHKKTPLKQNQFGFALGGPVVLPGYNGHDRSFWFASYEGGRRRITSGTQFAQVPTAKELNGDFSDWPYPIYDPATTGSVAATVNDPTGRQAFPNNQIPSSRFNPIAVKLLNYFPKANINCSMQCPDFVGTTRNPFDTDVFTARVDQRIGNHNQLSYTMVMSRLNTVSPSIMPDTALEIFTRPRLFGLEWDHNLSPDAYNTAHLAFNRQRFHFGAISSFGPNLSSQLGFMNTTTNPAFYGLPSVSVQDGYLGAGTGNNGYTQTNNIYQYVDTFHYIHGKHSFTMGADIRRIQLVDFDSFQANGTLTFTGSYTASNPSSSSIGKPSATTGNAFADLLLGYPLRVGPPTPFASDLYDTRATALGFYFQDDFRATPRLTLNLGLRYEIPDTFHSRSNSGSVFNLKTPGGGLIYADKNFVQKYGPGSSNPTAQATYFQCCVTNQLVPGDKTDFAPRIGFAWRPLETSKLVLRGGYGIYYDTYNRFYDLANYDDNLLSVIVPNPNYPVALGTESASPLALNTLWLPPVSVTASVPPPYQFGIQTLWPDNHTPYTQQWGLDTQYAFTPDLMLDVGYVGSHAIHEPIQWEFNAGFPPTVVGDPCNYLRDISQATGSRANCLTDPNFQPVDTRDPFPNFSPSSYANANILSSNYHSLQVRLEKRFSHGIELMSNYTWSKALDEGSEIAAFGGEALNLVQNQHDLHREYAPANFDQGQRLVLSYLYDLPWGKSRTWSLGRANWIFGGWTTSGIISLATGLPFTVACCFRSTTQFGTPFGDSIRANVNGNPNQGFSQSIFQWFNASVFSTPPAGRFGDVSRNSLRAPGQHQADLSFLKDTPIGDRWNIQYRLDIFNFLSSWHTGTVFPNNRVASSPSPCTPGPGPGPKGNCNFGSLVPLNGFGELNLFNPRIIQMALRVTF